VKLPNILQTISSKLNSQNAKAILVGGSVRDHFLGLELKDYDIEVYGLGSIDELESLLKEYGHVKLVGKSFGVLKFIYEGFEYDFAFPRREVKSGVGHKGFDIVSDGFMSYEEASKRRDFTINALGYEIETKEFLDPFGGLEDIERKVLRHIDDKTFVEDPLRVYRGVQFCARLEYCMDFKTKELCKQMVRDKNLEELPKERVFEEIKKLLLKAKKPSIGFELLKEFGATLSLPKETNIKTLDKFSKNTLTLMLTLLTLHLPQKEIEEFLTRLTDEVKLIASVKAYVKSYQSLLEDEFKPSDTKLRRLATEVNLKKLSKICEDKSFLKDAKRLGVENEPLKELLQGRDLIALGYKPSGEFSKILKAVYELQLKGKITDKNQAIEFVKGQS
jgi:tRNA nucleotidyltransferase (CCA-adding enzyme)